MWPLGDMLGCGGGDRDRLGEGVFPGLQSLSPVAELGNARERRRVRAVALEGDGVSTLGLRFVPSLSCGRAHNGRGSRDLRCFLSDRAAGVARVICAAVRPRRRGEIRGYNAGVTVIVLCREYFKTKTRTRTL